MKTVIGLFCLLLLGGCRSDESKEEVEVEGQVFVVTKSRENIKMGLVPIHVVPDDQFEKIASELAEQIMAYREDDAQRKANHDALEVFIKELRSLEKPDLTVPAFKTLGEEAASFKNRFTPPEELEFVKARLFSQLPPTVVKTDADGRFKISFNSKVWAITQGERSVGEERKQYLWIMPVERPKEGSVSPILISNDSGYSSVEEVYALLAFVGGKAKELPSLSSVEVDQETAEWIKERKEKANSLIKAAMTERQAKLDAIEAEKQVKLDAAEAEKQAKLDAAEAEKQVKLDAAQAEKQAKLDAAEAEKQAKLDAAEAEMKATEVFAWGLNSSKQCDVPTGLTGVVGISGGGPHSLALKKNGTVVAWGDNDKQQCDVPTGLTDVVGISAGIFHSLALKKDGTVVAWGNNEDQQCDVPTGLTDVVGISGGIFYSLALKKNGTVVAWGDNDKQQCDVPTGLTDVVGIAAGGYHSLALKKDGTVVAWGSSSFNQCDVPTGLTDVVGIFGGGYHSLALKKDGTVVAWGWNSFNQCDVPTGLTDVVGISGGGYHSLVLKKGQQ